MLSFVYATCDSRERMILWQDLSSANINLPWMVVGDFNVVAYQEEKIGGCPINLNVSANFVNMT